MNSSKMSGFFKKIQTLVSKNSPEILTGIGIAGMITTTILAVKATPKAIYILEDLENEMEVDKIPTKEAVKAVWKCYVPAVVTGSISILCIVGGSSVNIRKNAALATAYTLSESALKTYKEKVVDTLGAKKDIAVEDAVAADKMRQNPIEYREIILTEKGNTICYDSISGRYFKSDIETLRKAENAINKLLINDMYVSLNEFYDEIGLDNVGLGDDLGWNIDKGGLALIFSSQLTSEGTPCLVIDYRIVPRYHYDR